jgi:hypothetical protein
MRAQAARENDAASMVWLPMGDDVSGLCPVCVSLRTVTQYWTLLRSYSSGPASSVSEARDAG